MPPSDPVPFIGANGTHGNHDIFADDRMPSGRNAANAPRGGFAGGARDRYVPETFLTPTDEYVKRYQARESFSTKSGLLVPDCDALLLEPVERSQRWRPVKVTSMPALRSFFESHAGQRKRMLESGYGSFDSENSDYFQSSRNTRLIDREYIPIMAGPFNKQLYIYDYLLMHARCFEMKNHNALASAANKIMTRFVLGRGLSFHIKNDQAQKVWDEFWERENMRVKIRQMVADLMWQGELLLRYYEPKPGFVKLRNLDASTCWEIVTDPEDIEQVYYYHFQWPTPYQIWVTGQIPVSRYIIQQIPPTNIQHVKINVSSQEKRGRSDLLPAMPWFKRFNDFYDGQTVKALLEANLVWKVKVKGDQADVDRFLSDPNLTELPPPGGVWIENEAVSLEPASVQLTGNRGSGGIGQQIASIIATSMNMPAEYFNIETTGPARATALVRTDPAVKAIEDRQQIIRETIEEMYDRVMANALQGGRLPGHAVKDDPELMDDDGTSSGGLDRKARDAMPLSRLRKLFSLRSPTDASPDDGGIVGSDDDTDDDMPEGDEDDRDEQTQGDTKPVRATIVREPVRPDEEPPTRPKRTPVR